MMKGCQNSQDMEFFSSRSTSHTYMGGSPDLMVMGDDSCSKGCGFESWRHILDGHLDIFYIDLL